VFSADVESDAQSGQVSRVLRAAAVLAPALAGIMSYRPVALMKEAFIVGPCPC